MSLQTQNFEFPSAKFRASKSDQVAHACPLRATVILSLGLAELVIHYIEAINSPGMIPNVQTAWENFVMTKCSEACQASFQLYKETITAELSGKLPCDRDVIRQEHEMALQKGLALFEDETFGIAATTTEKYRRGMMVGINEFNFLRETRRSAIVSRAVATFALRRLSITSAVVLKVVVLKTGYCLSKEMPLQFT